VIPAEMRAALGPAAGDRLHLHLSGATDDRRSSWL